MYTETNFNLVIFLKTFVKKRGFDKNVKRLFIYKF